MGAFYLVFGPMELSAGLGYTTASRQFRITLETNRYSVPAHYAGQVLTLKTYPDRLCVYRGDALVARHAPLIVDTRGVYREKLPNLVKA